MKRILFLFNLLIVLSSVAQDSSKKIIATPFNPKSHHHTWGIKGSALPWFIGNDIGIATTLGVEYAFLKNQSIGVDGFLHLSQGSHDTITDTSGVLHDVGGFHHFTEKAVFINYRYYFNFKKLRERKGIAFYTSTYFRYGYTDRHEDPLYPSDYITQNEYSSSEGILIGAIFKDKNSSRFFYDVNVGHFIKNKDISTVYIEDHVVKTKTESSKVTGLRIGLYVSYYIF